MKLSSPLVASLVRTHGEVTYEDRCHMTFPFQILCQTVATPRLAAAKQWRVVTTSIGVILSLLLGSCSLWTATSSQTDPQVGREIVNVIDAYMQAMADKEVAQAYALLSSRAHQVYSLTDIEQLVQSSYWLFEGYQATQVEKIVVTKRLSTDLSLPGTSISASGKITYAGGIQGTFEADLEQENGQWRLSKIWVVVPPEKLETSPEAIRHGPSWAKTL